MRLNDTVHLLIRKAVQHLMYIGYPAFVAYLEFCQCTDSMKLCRPITHNRSTSNFTQDPIFSCSNKMGGQRKKRIGLRQCERLIEQLLRHSAQLRKDIVPDVIQHARIVRRFIGHNRCLSE